LYLIIDIYIYNYIIIS